MKFNRNTNRNSSTVTTPTVTEQKSDKGFLGTLLGIFKENKPEPKEDRDVYPRDLPPELKNWNGILENGKKVDYSHWLFGQYPHYLRPYPELSKEGCPSERQIWLRTRLELLTRRSDN